MTADRSTAGLPPAVVLAVLSAVLAAPCLWFRDIPLFDLPVHIARQHILYDPAIAVAREHYQVLWRVLPNLALDLSVWLLHWVVPIDLAVRIFLAITVVQLFLGAVALNRALFGPAARFGWIAALFAYSSLFLIGLVNLCFGVGLCLWVMAVWITLRGRTAGIAICGGLAILVLLAHLYAFAFYGLLVGTYALGQAFGGTARPASARARGLALDLAHLAVPLGFYALAVPRGFNEFLPLYWDAKEKLWALLTVLGVYNLVFDLACLAGLIYLLLVFRRSVVLAPAMRLPLLALVAAFFVLPYQVGNATWVDARVPSTFALVLVASLDWRVPGRFPRLGEAGLAALFALRMAVLVVEWASWQPVFAEYHAAMALVDPGTKLLPIGTHPAELRAGEHPPLPHMDAFAVSQRGAFIPTMLADRAYELLHYTAADERIHNDFPDRPVIADYDFVLIVDPDHDGIPPEVEPVFRGTGFVLARVRR